ncbi:MAG TPA: hypothetical protein VGF84_01485 [Micromonosporaceae bacterium]
MADGSSSADRSSSAFDRPSYAERSHIADESPFEAPAGAERSLDDPWASEPGLRSLDDPRASESGLRSLDDPRASESRPVERSLPGSQSAPVEQAFEPSPEQAFREPSEPVPADESVAAELPGPAMRAEDRDSGSASLFGADDWASIAVPSEADSSVGSPQPQTGPTFGNPQPPIFGSQSPPDPTFGGPRPADADFGGSPPPVDPVVEAMHAFGAEYGPTTAGREQSTSSSQAGASDQAFDTEREPGVAEHYLDVGQPSVDPRSFRQGLDEADRPFADRPWSSAGPGRSFGQRPGAADEDFGGAQLPADADRVSGQELGGDRPWSPGRSFGQRPGAADEDFGGAQLPADADHALGQALGEDRPWSPAGPGRSFGHNPSAADEAFGGAQRPVDADRVSGQEFGGDRSWSTDRSFERRLGAADEDFGGGQPPADADRVSGQDLGEDRPWSPADSDRSFGHAVEAYGYGRDSLANQSQAEPWAQPEAKSPDRLERRTSQPDSWPDPPERWEPLGTRSTAADSIAPERTAIEPNDGASRTTTPPYVARASVTPFADYGRSDDRNVGYARPAEPLPPQARPGSSTAGSYGSALEDRLGTAPEDEVAPHPKAHKPFSEKSPVPQWLVPEPPPEPPNDPPNETPPGSTTPSDPGPVVARVRASARVPGLIVEAPPVEGAEPMSAPPHAVANASAPPAELRQGGRGPFPLVGDIPAPDLSALVELQIPTGSKPNPGVDEDIAGEGMDRPLPVPHAVEAEPNADGGWPFGPEANAAESPYSSEDWRSNLLGSRAAQADGAGTVYRGEAEDEEEAEDEPLSLTQWILRSLVVALIIGALVFSFLEGPWISSHL